MTVIIKNTVNRASDFLVNHLIKSGCLDKTFDIAVNRFRTMLINNSEINKVFQSQIKFRKLSEEEFDRQEAKLLLFKEVVGELITESDKPIDTYSSRLLVDERIKANGEKSVILNLSIEDAFTAEEWQELKKLSDKELFKELSKTCMVNENKISRAEMPKRYTVEILTRGNSDIMLSNNSSFYNTIFTHIDISGLKCIDRRKDDTAFIADNYALKEINITNLDISNIESLDNFIKHNMFLRKMIGLETLKMENVVSAENMFSESINIEELNTTGWKLPKVKNLDFMFYRCINLKRIIGINEWNPKSLEHMNYTFEDTGEIEEIDLSNWKPLHLKSMVASFYNCRAGKISLPDLSYVTEHCILTNTTSLFRVCIADSIRNLNTMNFDNYKIKKVKFYFDSMFESSNIKDKKFMQGFNIMKVFKFGDTIRGIAELTSSALACKELDVTYWRKFMTDPEIEEAANKIFFYTYEKNDEVFIIRRLGCKARIRLIEQREGKLL